MSAVQRPTSGAPGRPASGRTRRPYSAYTRKGEEEEGPKFEAPETNREWWRAYLKVGFALLTPLPHVCYPQETPVPGSYKHRSFVEDLHGQPSSYRFRDTSRVKSASHQRFERTGQQLLPGAYESSGFLHELGRKKVTYGFLDTQRGEGPKIGHGYGDKVF